MASKAIEEAFQRHPRPQVPTKAALLKKALQKDISLSSRFTEVQESPWKSIIRQGYLTQGENVWRIGFTNDEKQPVMVMVKKVTLEAGRQELEKLSKLSHHPHVATIQQAFGSETSLFFQLEYARYTLEEVLKVSMPLGEAHIRVIASSIFLAIKHIATAGIMHNAISIATIRFCASGKPLLSNFEDSVWVTTKQTLNSDLEHLGVVILECMNGKSNESLRNPTEVRRLRESNKTFGLDNGEQWSGFKLLVDFLDNMFNNNVPAIAKLEKPVSAPRSV